MQRMPPLVEALFDALFKLLIAAAVIAVTYRLIVRRGRATPMVEGDDPPDGSPDSPGPEPSAPFLDPVPALSATMSDDVDEPGMDEPGMDEPGIDEPAGAALDDPGPFVTVATYQDVERAHLARLCLEQEGIPAFVADASVVGTVWWYSNAVHGVKVQVPEHDALEAREALAVAEHAGQPAPPPVDDADSTAPRCQHCGSTEVYRVPKGRGLFFLLLLILSLALPVVVRRYQCDHCGTVYWEEPGAGD